MQNSLKKLILDLFDIGAFQFGQFKFKHHEKNPNAPLAPMKINLRTPNHPTEPGNLTPEIIFAIATQFMDIIDLKKIRFDHIVGLPRAGEPFAEAMAKVMNKPLIRIRKSERQGRRKIESVISDHFFEPGGKVILMDDVITKGGSKEEAINAMDALGLSIAAIIVFVNRQEGGMETYQNLGYRMISATNITDILKLGLTNAKITVLQYKQCLEYLELSRENKEEPRK